MPSSATIEPPPRPHATSSASTLRRAGLTTQVEVHDRQQLEVRLNYAIGSEQGPQLYTVDAYFFVPRNIGLNRNNYSREQFYADVTALMRIDAASLPLDELANPDNPASPLYRFQQSLREFETARRPPSSRPVAVHVKLYAFLFAGEVRNELSRLRAKLAKFDAEGKWDWVALENDVRAWIGRMKRALTAYRRLRSAFWPYEKVSIDSLRESLRSADEYMSLYLEERLTLFARDLAEDPRRLDGSGGVTRVRLLLAELAREEAAYRKRYGYLVYAGQAEGEYFTYRASLLKKAVQQALYLDLREVKRDTFLRNAVGAVGAALAAIWALATQLPATLAAFDSETKYVFFTAAVLAYVMKDRIKAITNEYLTARLRRYDHTSWVQGETLSHMGLGALRARLREAMRFLSGRDVPEDIRKMRLTRRTVRGAEVLSEEVIHYRKSLLVGTGDDESQLPEGYWVRDIVRLNVRHFIARLDDPMDRVFAFDPARDAFAIADLPKVYHLNLVLKVTREDASGSGQARLEHLRVVLNKDGIVRSGSVDSVGPIRIEAPPRGARRWWWPFS